MALRIGHGFTQAKKITGTESVREGFLTPKMRLVYALAALAAAGPQITIQR